MEVWACVAQLAPQRWELLAPRRSDPRASHRTERADVRSSAALGARVLIPQACQEWLFQQHKAYAVPTEQREALDPSLLKTY